MRKVSRTAARTMPRVAFLAVASLALSSCYFLDTARQHQEESPDTRPWWCHSSGGDDHHDHGADGALSSEDSMEMPTKGMLSWDDCLTNSEAFDEALRYAMRYPTKGDALAAGFDVVIPYTRGMGSHLTQLGDFDITDPGFDPAEPVFDGTALDHDFDPTRPEFLQYDGDGRDAKLVGMSWYVRSHHHAPEGFAGTNDQWHVHPLICFSDSMRFMGQNRTDQECEAAGGTNVHLDDYHMVHAWIVPGWDHRPDVFVNHHPCLQRQPVTDPSAPCRKAIAHGN